MVEQTEKFKADTIKAQTDVKEAIDNDPALSDAKKEELKNEVYLIT